MTCSNVTLPSTSRNARGYFFVILHVEHHRAADRCADISSHKQDGTSVVTHSE
jgi:hypothetical protein